MSIQRILVLQSVQDDITDRRIERIGNSPFLQGYSIEHCYAVELTEEDRRKLMPQMMFEVTSRPLDEEDLLGRIEANIQSFRPDALIVHAGFVFHRFPDTFMRVLSALKARYPSIRFGIEGARGLDADLGLDAVFEQSSEMQDLVALLF